MNQSQNGSYVTVQRTSKNIKAAQLLSSLMIITGTITCSAHQPEASALLWLSGMALGFGAKVAKWWHHD